MKIVAYLYSEPLLDSPPDPDIWGWEIDAVYQDWGDRVQRDRLLADLRAEPPDYLLVRRLDELGNSVEEIGEVLAICDEHGVKPLAIEQAYSPLDPEDASSERARLFEILPAIEADRRRRNLQKGHARNRLQALPPPGKAPYGYRRGKERYILDRSTAPVVKEFFDHFLLYGSLRGAVRHLEQKYGKKISVSTGRRWLTNPVYRGDLAYKDDAIVPNAHTAIVTREEAAQVDRLLRRNRRLPPRSASAPRSLAGLAFCQNCQSPHTVTRVLARGKSKEYLYLRPTECTRQPKCPAIAYETVLQRTIERICEDLPPAVARPPALNVAEIKTQLAAEIVEKQEILARLPQLQAEGILDAETAALRRYKLQTEIAHLTQKQATLPPENLPAIAQAIALPQFWLDLSEAERRFYFREFLQRIELIRSEGELQSVQLIFFL